jgi:hypothetical protein
MPLNGPSFASCLIVRTSALRFVQENCGLAMYSQVQRHYQYFHQ